MHRFQDANQILQRAEESGYVSVHIGSLRNGGKKCGSVRDARFRSNMSWYVVISLSRCLIGIGTNVVSAVYVERELLVVVSNNAAVDKPAGRHAYVIIGSTAS